MKQNKQKAVNGKESEKDAFISIVAHQLKAPLTVAKGYLSMLYEGAFGKLSAKQILAVSKAYCGNEDLINIVENLLNFSRIKNGRITYNFDKISLNEIIKNVLEQFEVQIKSKKLKINRSDKPKQLPFVVGDAGKLKNIIAILIDNMIKYNKDGSKIDINITADEKNVICEITDNGVGMNPRDAECLFEKFSGNIKKIPLEIVRGSGLGLYIAQYFISAHKGKAWSKSLGYGKGHAFGFSLPIG